MNFRSPSFRRAAVALFAALLPATVALAQDASHLKNNGITPRNALPPLTSIATAHRQQADTERHAVRCQHFDQIDTAKTGKVSFADNRPGRSSMPSSTGAEEQIRKPGQKPEK